MWRNALLAFATFSASNAQILEKCKLEAPENGEVKCHTAFDKLNMCEITCNEGYTRSDNMVFACVIDEETTEPVWSPKVEGNRFPACYKIDEQCNDLEAPENGFIHCETDPETSDRLCWPECKQNFMFEHQIPLRGYYRCSANGSLGWKPSNQIPKCIAKPANIDEIQGLAENGILDREAIPADQQGYCMTWGEHHYRTFDGRMYRFSGKCSYILATDEQTFSVTLHNDPDCDGTKDCKRTLSVSYSQSRQTVKKIPLNGAVPEPF